MQKPLIRLFLLICLVIPFAAFAQTTSDDGGVENVNLESDSIIYCPWSSSKTGECSSQTAIDVYAISKNADKDGLEFYYLVDGGKIIGRGSQVVWEFSDTRFGKYSITVAVGKNGIIKGKAITKSIQFQACPVCDKPCECAEISVTGPTAPAKRGETVIFKAQISGGTQSTVEYNWTVSSGTIVSGQGTPNILVKTDKDKRISEVTATVDIGGLCQECPRTASATVELKDK